MNIFLKVITYLFYFYLVVIDILYYVFKYYKKDKRFIDVSFLKFFDSPVRVFKGEFINKEKGEK